MSITRWLVMCLVAVLAAGCTLLPGLGPSALDTTTSQRTTLVAGRVLGLDGKPASGVEVRGYRADDGLISNNAGSLISNNAGSYRVASNLAVVTDPEGRFSMSVLPGVHYNVEAVQSDDVKAMRLGSTGTDGDLTLQLAYTGTLEGKVTAPSAPTFTDFQGVDVFVPGTGYLAKADSSGHFTLLHVAAGAYDLVASKAGANWQGHATGVRVEPRKTTQTPDLALALVAPHVDAIAPLSGGPGTVVRLTGSHFGASTGDPFQVSFGGGVASQPQRLDDGTLEVVVPAAAHSGDVIVTVNGASSNALTFKVVRTLSLMPTLGLLGLHGSRPLTLRALDPEGNAIADPVASWSVEGVALSLTGSVVTGQSLGTGTVRVTSGDVVATMSLKVTDRTIVTTIAGNGDDVLQDGPALEASFYWPDGVAVAPDGTVAVADQAAGSLRRLTPDGEVQSWPGLTGTLGSPAQLAYGPAGDLYVTDADHHRILKVTPEGQQVEYTDGRLLKPTGVAVDSQGVAYVADQDGHCVFTLSPEGLFTPLASASDGRGDAERLVSPSHVAVSRTGTVYVTDRGSQRILAITPGGLVSTLAGSVQGNAEGVGAAARFDAPTGICLDPAGTLYVADCNNHRICRVTPEGAVTTLAGTLPYGFQDGEGNKARFSFPIGLTYAHGELLVADYMNQRIRSVSNLP